MQHHANLLIGPVEWALSVIPDKYKKESQDVRILDYGVMNIAHARELIRSANLRPSENDSNVFIVIVQKILREAQNSLLKLLEEPNRQTLFYFIIPNEELLIPTLRSRFHILATDLSVRLQESFIEFKKLSHSERLKFIEKKLKEKDVKWVCDIVESFEVHAHITKDKKFIKDVLMLVKYININGSSKKMLLEHVSLSL